MSNQREEFEKWLDAHYHREVCGDEDFAFAAWQAATEASDARYQARVRELEERLKELHDEVKYQLAEGIPSPHRLQEENVRADKALSTTTPDTALQRALLEARMDELRSFADSRNYKISPEQDIEERINKLREELAALGE